jgi:hypothetical protein
MERRTRPSTDPLPGGPHLRDHFMMSQIDPSSTQGGSAQDWAPRDSWACLFCALAGLFLAVAPHVATRVHWGTWEFLSDNDDLYYVGLARHAYHGELTHRDAFAGRWEHVPEPHAWVQFGPSAVLARTLGLRFELLNLLWRAIGGSLFGLSLYVLFRRLLARTGRPTYWSLGCALVCLSDAGFIAGRTIVQAFILLPHLGQGTTPLMRQDAFAQYRVVTPLMNLPFLLLLAAAVVPANASKERIRNVILGAICLAACVLLYFYFWTAAVIALGGYATILAFRAWREPEHRQMLLTQAALAALILVGGLALGSPQILSNLQSFNDPQIKPLLERAGRGEKLPPGDPFRYHHLVNMWCFARLAVGAVGILILRIRGLGFLWCLSFAGYGLANSAMITGLEFENAHWAIVFNGVGEVMVLTAACVFLDRQPWATTTVARKLLSAVPATMFLFATVWRLYASVHAPGPITMEHDLAGLRSLRASLAKLDDQSTLAGAPLIRVAMLSCRSAILFSEPYTPTTLIPLEESTRKHALNGWLQGFTLEEYAQTATPSQGVGLHVITVERQPPAIGRARLEEFQKLLDHPDIAESLADHYRVAHLLLPTSAPTPTRAGPWRLLDTNAEWTVWTRNLSPTARRPSLSDLRP